MSTDAWNLILDHSDWAEEVRAHLLRFGETQPERLQALLQAGPTLGQLWSDYSMEGLRRLLTPDHDVAVAWQLSKARAGDVFVPLVRVDEHLWRGPQPTAESLRQMTGLRAVVNLRRECSSSHGLAAEAGLHYLDIPVQDMSVPRFEQVVEFLDHFRAEGPAPALVHCFAGQGRTGLFVACYRIWRGMDVEQAIALTDQETGRRGMRPSQRAWVREHAGALF